MPHRRHRASSGQPFDTRASGLVPFQPDAFNPFDGSYSFGASLQPLFPAGIGTTMFGQDDIFLGLRQQMNKILDSVQYGFRDDSMLQRLSPFNMPSWTNTVINPNDPNTLSHMHTATQVMSYSNIDGKPKLVQSHDEKEIGPGGVWRTRKAHRNTEKGIEKMQEGLFIGDQGEIRERFRNPQTNQLEDRLYHQNVPPEQRQHFVDEWNRRAEEARRAFCHGTKPSIGSPNYYPPVGY